MLGALVTPTSRKAWLPAIGNNPPLMSVCLPRKGFSLSCMLIMHASSPQCSHQSSKRSLSYRRNLTSQTKAPSKTTFVLVLIASMMGMLPLLDLEWLIGKSPLLACTNLIPKLRCTVPWLLIFSTLTMLLHQNTRSGITDPPLDVYLISRQWFARI